MSSFSTSRRSPPSPLFPYTTLFRSPRPLAEWREFDGKDAESVIEIATKSAVLGHPSQVPIGRGHQSKVDRKSTRLNSSHANISYAVFCLKKKNIKTSVITTYIYHAN